MKKERGTPASAGVARDLEDETLTLHPGLQLRVSLHGMDRKERPVMELRHWRMDSDQRPPEFRPTHEGVKVPVHRIAELISALERAALRFRGRYD